MATTSIADKLAKLEKKIAKREKAIADETKELDKDRAEYNKLYIMFLSDKVRDNLLAGWSRKVSMAALIFLLVEAACHSLNKLTMQTSGTVFRSSSLLCLLRSCAASVITKHRAT